MGCGASVAAEKDETSDENKSSPANEKGVKKAKKEAKRRRSASGMLENMVHEEFDKGKMLCCGQFQFYNNKSVCDSCYGRHK